MPGLHGSGRGGVREWDSNGADGRNRPSWRGRAGSSGGGGGAGDNSEGQSSGPSWRGRGRGFGRGGQEPSRQGGWGRQGRGGGGGRGGGRGAGAAGRSWRDGNESLNRTANTAESSTSTASTSIATSPSPSATSSPAEATAASRDGRLKPPRDPTGGHGLISKGDTKLLDPSAQELLFDEIQDKYSDFISARRSSSNSSNTTTTSAIRTQHIDTHTATTQSLLLALRSLREALLATSRIDDFTTNVYIYNSRVAILFQNKESYLPSLLHLLYNIHPNRPLPPEDLAEFATYYVLHLACVSGEINQAYIVQRQFIISSSLSQAPKEAHLHWTQTTSILRALVQNNYHSWARLKLKVSLEKRKLMEMREQNEILNRAIGCISKTYFEIERSWLEDLMGMKLEEVRRKFSGVDGVVGVQEWGVEDEGRKIVVRKRGKK